MEQETLVTLTADIVAAHVSNNSVAVGDIGNLVKQVHEALGRLGAEGEEAKEEKKPAVSVRASVKPDYLVCLECGKKQKTLKRHLQTAHGMAPEEYRQAYGLSADYPMTAPNYSAQRSEMAKQIGLGSKGRKGRPAKGKGRRASAKKANGGAAEASGK